MIIKIENKTSDIKSKCLDIHKWKCILYMSVEDRGCFFSEVHSLYTSICCYNYNRKYFSVKFLLTFLFWMKWLDIPVNIVLCFVWFLIFLLIGISFIKIIDFIEKSIKNYKWKKFMKFLSSQKEISWKK